MSGLSSTGFLPLSLNDVKTQIENNLKSKLGPQINLLAPGLMATIVGIMAERESLIWAVAEDVYNSQYPDTASGTSLDNVVAFSGISRLASTPSRYTSLLLFGTSGTTVPAGTKIAVQGSPSSIFKTDSAATLTTGVDEVQKITFGSAAVSGSFVLTFRNETMAPLSFSATASDIQSELNGLNSLSECAVSGNASNGFVITFAGVNGKQPQPLIAVSSNTLTNSSNLAVSVSVSELVLGVPQASVSVTATVTGPTVAPARSLTVITTPVSGLDRVLNQFDAVVGRSVEDDLSLRIRRTKTLQIGGSGTRDAIRSKLLSQPGVTDVFIFENLTLIPDLAGRPPKSYEVVVAGGVDQVITQTIWNTKPAGIQTDGAYAGVAVDTQGANQPVRWSRPTVVPIYLELDIVTDYNYPQNGDDQAVAAILVYGAALRIGQSIYVTPQLVSSLDEIPGIIGITVKIGTTPGPGIASSVTIAIAQIASFDTSRIVVHSV